ncbi:LysR family transcriptional regulator [Roseovarius sp. EL26]|uniref:LysR family transcriptional regulator n=1 Tax=Roseovarius sp. EL26 TaxID=2126672 RepID=UPI0013C448BC|nr:LysR family transcriptional regulator [Roseovarius sp. EL26]
MNWDNLKILLEISRAGSLTAAAHRLGMDQSTVGRRLNALESDVGSVLFVRSKAGFVATESGHIAVARAQEMEKTSLRLDDELSGPKAGATGLVRLNGNAWTLQRLAETALPTLLQANPDLDVHLESTPPPAPVRGDATVSLWFEVQPVTTEFAVELGKVPYAVYQSAIIPPKPHDWVQFLDERADRPQIAKSALRQMNDEDRTCVTATDASILLSAVRNGIGKGLLPVCIAHAASGLARTNPGPPEIERPLFMHLNPDTVEYKRIQTTMSWLRKSFNEIFRDP